MKFEHKATMLAAACALALALPAVAVQPQLAANDSWVTVSGKVRDPRADAFTLDYGRGQILVEMDDWDWYREGRNLIAGDEVTVSGKIDDDLFERRSIEAGSVYVKGLNTYFYASPSDEESAVQTTVFLTSLPLELGETRATGKVTEIDDRSMVVDTGALRVRVNTESLGYDPFDDKGFQRIEVGDRVTVNGDMTPAFFSARRQLDADLLIKLQADSARGGRDAMADAEVAD